MSAYADSDALHQRVRAFIRASMAELTGTQPRTGTQPQTGTQQPNAPGHEHAAAPEPPAASPQPQHTDDFDTLACALARHQARHIPAVARLFHARGVAPEQLTRAADIPAVVCDVFRHRRIATHPEQVDVRRFLTSGTSQGRAQRGCHPLRTTDTYAAGALAWGRHMLFPDRTDLDFVGLVSSQAQAPESSLGFMLARFAEQLSGEASFHWDGERLDVAGVVRRCRAATEQGRALLVAGTSFAFVHLCDALTERGETLPLPLASRVMQTGGFKGRSRQVDAAELSAAIATLFALPPSHIISEYGMTELSSQLYQGGLRHALFESHSSGAERYVPPPWLRASAVDPLDLTPLPAGELGLCRLVDLANVDSAVAIQTADRVRVHRDGSLTLHGRQPGATPRGCSLAMEHILEPA